MERETTALELVRLIILEEMNTEEAPLKENRVMIYNQKWKIPSDSGIFISIGTLGFPKVYRNDSHTEARDAGFYEVKNTNYQELITVDIFSKNLEALYRKEEILHALASQYAQQTQEKYGFKIARIPTEFKDLSELEATALLYRFQIIIPVLSWASKEKIVEYFDNFTGKINTEQVEVEFVQKTEE